MKVASIFLLVVLASAPGASGDTLLVANKSDATVDLLEPASGEKRATLPTGEFPHEIAVSPDGATAVVTNYGDRERPGSSLTVVDVSGAAVTRTIELGEHTRPHGLAWLSDRSLVVTTEGSKHLLVVEIDTGEVRAAIETAQDISHMVAATGGRAFVANIGSGTVTVIDIERGEKLKDIATGDGAEGIDIAPDGGEVWVTNRAADTLSVIDPDTLEIVETVPCPGFPIRVRLTPDGSRVLVSAARSGEVVVFDRATREELARSQLDLSTVEGYEERLFGDRFGDSPVPVGLVVSPDGRTAWVAATQADTVVSVSTVDLEVTGLLQAGREPDGMAWSPR
ncbi:MAG: beta-propeller fold lactonase family protein [Thermoanaerobaculia bacterium]